MSQSLPPFRAITQDELRRFWVLYPHNDTRRLILEIERNRRALKEIVRLTEQVHDAWRHHVGGNHSALFALKQVLATEKHRGVIDVVPYPNVPNY